MIHVTGRRAERALLLLLYLGGKRSGSALSALRIRTPLSTRHTSAAVHVCRPTSRALSSAAIETTAEPRSLGAAVEESSPLQGRKLSKAVVVARGKARLFWDGNPLVYGGAISRVEGDPMAGDVVDVIDSSGKFIAWGVFNPDSMYRVRVLAREGEAAADSRDVGAVVKERLMTARDARRAIGIPNANTDTYRLVNGEGDRLSGLVIDVFAGVVGVSSSAVWVEAFRPEIEAALGEVFGADATEVIWRRSDGRLQQDGWKGNTPGAGAGPGPGAAAAETTGREGDADEKRQGEGKEVAARRLRSDAPTTVVREHGLEYEVRPQFGQKTAGFYCDQRESREAVRELSSGKNVLDM
ncbi:unnamed protein product [Hapterophycus canaliculatus]